MAELPNTDGNKAEGGKKTKPGRNGFDPSMVNGFVERIENLQDEIDQISQQAKEDTAPMRDGIAEVKKEAVDSGLPRQALNAALSHRRHLSKAAKVRDGLTENVKDDYDKLLHALGQLAHDALTNGEDKAPAS